MANVQRKFHQAGFPLDKDPFFIYIVVMGYVFDFKDAKAYQQWCEDPRNGFAADMQRRLILDMLRPVRGDSVIEIGCGTGRGLRPFIDQGLNVTGLDPSPYMLDIAKQNLGHRADLHRGRAEDLPFEDNSFNLACFMTTLEFVEDPVKALEEACRVAKDRIFVGVLNRYALKSIQRRIKGVFVSTIYNRARFFSVWELTKILKSILGDVPITWRTVCHLSETPGSFLGRVENYRVLQRCPFGAFAGLVVKPEPRFRTKPLGLKYHQKHGVKPVAGGQRA